MATKTIKGRIIRIIDNRTVIINLGSKDGIKESSIFRILADPEQIIDPQTKELLGCVNVVKSKLKASLIEDRFTIATTRWTYMTSGEDAMSKIVGLASLSITSGHKTHVVDEGELNVPDSELQPWKAKSEIPVRVGDEVETEIYITDKNASVKEMIESASKVIVKDSKEILKNFDIVTSPENADYIVNFIKIDGSALTTKIINRSGLNSEIIKEEILKQIPKN
jgi:hypothetical protein